MNPIVHGTVYAYARRECRCPICTAAYRDCLDAKKRKRLATHPQRTGIRRATISLAEDRDYYKAAYYEQKAINEKAIQVTAQYWQELQRLKKTIRETKCTCRA